MKKVNILTAALMGLVLFFSVSTASAQQPTKYTPSLEMVSSSVVGGHTQFVYRLTGDAAEKNTYSQWLRGMQVDHSVITSITVDPSNTTCTVTMAGISSPERGQIMLNEFDQRLRMKDAALKGPNAAAERKLHEEHARNTSSTPSNR